MLSLAEHRGLDEEYLRHFARASPGDGSICSRVVEERRPVYVPDVTKDAAFAPHLDISARAGCRAVYALPLCDPTDELWGVVSAHFPETRRITGEEERALEVVARLARLLARSGERATAVADDLREEERFLAMVSHELRSPLNVLKHSMELLRRSSGGAADVAKTLRVVDRQIDRMTRLVGDVLDLSRIGRGLVEIDRRRIDLGALLRELASACRPDLRARDLSLETCLPEGPIEVEGDRVRLEQVFQNLIENAGKFTPAGGRVEVSAGIPSGGDEVVVVVADTGVGMPPEILSTIFAADRRPRRRGSDLGLGLTIVCRLVDLHGGRVEAESPGPGRGSTFRVRLPRADAPRPPLSG